jgi:hypothetical protein
VAVPLCKGRAPGKLSAVRTFTPAASAVVSSVSCVAAAAVLTLAGCAAGPAAQPGGTSAAHIVTAPLAGRQNGELDVMSGATSITVATAHLGGDLLRVSTPAGAGIKPDLVVSGTVQLYLDSTGTNGPAAVRVTLNSGVAWRLAFSGGSTQTAVFLGGGRLRGADFAAGSSQIRMRLPRPHGTVTIELAGGASQVALAAPGGVPARLRLDGGASTATLSGRTYTGIAGGTVLTAPGWAHAADRYDIEAPAGVSTISVGTW